MRPATLLLLWFGGLLACGPAPENVTEPAGVPTPTPDRADSLPDYDLTFEPGQRVGAITATTDSAALYESYGADQVRDTAVYVGEGMTQPGAIIFPGRPEELALTWVSEARRRPEVVFIRRPDAPWTSRESGVHIGTTLEELEQLNGRPFTFSGFGWDYAGTVTDWAGGQLAGFHLRLAPDTPEQNDRIPASLSGERPVRSDNQTARALGLCVKEIYLVLNRPPE
jgi:hypothetical protein